jgi:outer membrane scaffolding protein for murein synthesis (MipA/OmpV family)
VARVEPLSGPLFRAAGSARSGLATFNASDGVKDVGVTFALTYSITENWNIGGLVGYQRLLNDAEDSPAAKIGSENQYLVD